ncbi:hypothetical protein IPJ72_03520 [Candidatus Peregrinibacteria bacterium]|nr:MAG: hypothetical protein IPJ72_03520 [Candidatus Peregrinibacteria bacterium]
MVLKIHLNDHKKVIDRFFKEHDIKRAIVKPATGGSSIGVHSVSTAAEALKKAQELFSRRMDTRVVIEPFCEGIEFTVIVLQNRFGLPVAILPTEMEIDYADHQIFDFRKKYLATRHVTYHCPPRFENQVVERIQIQAEQLFKTMGMQDFARFDGWLLSDGNIWFSDFNPISGMEQNSFLFQQTSRIGMSHADLLKYIVKNACRRHNIPFPKGYREFAVGEEHGIVNSPQAKSIISLSKRADKEVNILFGGKTAERQVSIMSGTNVWLKLRKSEKIQPNPYLLDTKGEVWKLPYYLTLNHTVEEIEETCKTAEKDEKRLHQLKTRILDKLGAMPGEINEPIFLPQKMSLDDFIKQSKFVFIGLHGGIGEDGTLQNKLEKAKVPFNGSGSKASKLCMDKYQTGLTVKALEKEGIYTANKTLVPLDKLFKLKSAELKTFWESATKELDSKTVIVKPVGDGCSAGIARLYSTNDLAAYLKHVQKKSAVIPMGELENQHGIIEMPTEPMHELLLEQFISTDQVRVVDNELKWRTQTEWIEITMGLIEKNGKLYAMNPSITVTSGSVLTLEEKFQGGTGVNITPPPEPFVKKSAVENAKRRMEKVANALGIQGYARIDAFMHVHTGELIIIEANSTPGLTPSTVIYHQALTEKPSMNPTLFLESIIKAAK